MSVKTSSSLNRNASQIPREFSGQIQARIDREQALRKQRQNIIVVGVPDLGMQSVPKPHSSYGDGPATPESIPEVVFTVRSTAGSNDGEEIGQAGDVVETPAPATDLRHSERQELPETAEAKEADPQAIRIDDAEAETRSHKAHELDAIAVSLKEMLERQVSEVESRSEVRAVNRMVAEESDNQWSRTGNDNAESERGVSVPPAKTDPGVGLPINTEIDEKAVTDIADQILRKFPGSGSTAVIGFTAAEPNSDVSEMCAAVAHELAAREQGQVLLVDGDFETGKMSTAARKSTVNGLKNLLMRSTITVDQTLVKSNSLSLDFLPVGNIKVKYWLRASERLQDILQQIRPAYRFVCVSLGDAHWKSTKVVSSSCDGVYLFVSMKETSRVVAESATQQFYESGTPILGCVVSDVPAAAA